MSPRVTHLCLRALFALLWICVGLGFSWSAGALYYLTWLPWVLRCAVSAAYLAAAVFVWRQLKNKRHWLALAIVSITCVYLLTLAQRPSNDRDWVAEQARMPTIAIADGRVKIENFRHTKYRSENDFDPVFRQFEFEFDQLDSVWFLVQRFTPLDGLAHTFISFGLETETGPEYLSVSVEIRREKGEIFSPVRGLYRQYEVIYVVGDERDLIGVRTNMRAADRVYLYRVNATPKQVQQLFLEVAQRAGTLQTAPEFYNTILNNCTNNIVSHTYKLTPEPINPLDLRIAIPGYSARFAYAMELIGSRGQSFRDLQSQCRIDEVAKRVGITEHFSRDIRAGMTEP